MSAPTTWIAFNDPLGRDDVLVEGERGPTQVKCSVSYDHDRAPKHGALPSTMNDDREEGMGTPIKDIVAYRITVVKEFADEGIVARAEDPPESLQELVLRT